MHFSGHFSSLNTYYGGPHFVLAINTSGRKSLLFYFHENSYYCLMKWRKIKRMKLNTSKAKIISIGLLALTADSWSFPYSWIFPVNWMIKLTGMSRGHIRLFADQSVTIIALNQRKVEEKLLPDFFLRKLWIIHRVKF